MADQTATFAVELRDEASGPAQRAAQEMEDLRQKITGDTKALAEMQKALRQLKSGTTVNTDAMSKLKDKIAAKKQEIANSQSSLLGLKDRFGDIAVAAKQGHGGLQELAQGLQAVNNPIGGLVGKVSSLTASMTATVAVIGLAVAAFVALAAAAAGAIAVLGRYALAVGDARRSEMLHLEGLTKIPNWYGIAAGKASDLRDAIDQVSASSAVGREQIKGYATDLYRMGMRGQNLADALEATSIAASAAGEQYASLVKSQVGYFGILGGSVKGYANHIREQMGGIAAKQALAFNVQLAKLKENLGRLFWDIKVDGFLKSLNEVLSLFSQQTETGKSLKAIIDAAFGGLGKFFEGPVGKIAKRFFQGLTLAALEMGIIILEVRNKLKEIFGKSKMLEQLDLERAAFIAGAVAGVLLAAALAAVAVAAAAVAVAIGLCVVGVALIGAAAFAAGFAIMTGLVMAFEFVRTAITEFWSHVEGKPWNELGGAIIDGILAGLKAGKDKVVAMAGQLASDIKRTFAGSLEMFSPSRVFKRYGINLPHSAAGGMEEGIPRLRAAAKEMADVTVNVAKPDLEELQLRAPKPPEPDTGPSGFRMEPEAGRAIEPTTMRSVVNRKTAMRIESLIKELHVHGDAKEEDARGIARRLEDELAPLLDRVLAMMGGEPDGLDSV